MVTVWLSCLYTISRCVMFGCTYFITSRVFVVMLYLVVPTLSASVSFLLCYVSLCLVLLILSPPMSLLLCYI
jgi:hypothetical protein